MLKNLKQIIKHSFIYSIGTISSKLIGVILLPLYTKHISITDFGLYGVFEIILLILPIIGLGLPFALQRWIGLSNQSGNTGSLIFTVYSFLFIYLIALFGLMIPVINIIINVFFNHNNFMDLFLIIFATVFFQILARVALVLLRMNKHSIYFAIANTAKIAFQLGLIVYLITIKNMGFVSIFWGEFLGTLVLFFITLPHVIKNFKFKFKFDELKKMIKYGVPSLLGNFSTQIFNASDRNFLLFYISDSALGIYLLGYKISSIIGVFISNSFNIAFPAIAWPQVGTENQNRFFSKIFTYFSFVLIWSTLLLVIYSEGIIHKFAQNNDYWSASETIPILAMGLVFNGMFNIFIYGFQINKETSKISLITIIVLGFNILFNILLVPILSYIGTAIANMATAIIRVVLAYLFSKNKFAVKWEFSKIIIMIVVATSIYLICQFFNNYSLFFRIFFKVIVFLSFPFILYLFNFYEQIEIETIKRISNKYLLFRKNKN